MHFILECTQCLQLRALPGGGHLQVRAALVQLSQVGLEPDGQPGFLPISFPVRPVKYWLKAQGPDIP